MNTMKILLPLNLLQFALFQFLLRQEVIKLYRDIFRTIRKIPNPKDRIDLIEWTRSDFRNNKNHTDEIVIKMLIHNGKRSLNELSTNLDLSGNLSNNTTSIDNNDNRTK